MVLGQSQCTVNGLERVGVVVDEAAANFDDRELEPGPCVFIRSTAKSLMLAWKARTSIFAQTIKASPLYRQPPTNPQHPPRLLATVKMLIPKADRKLIHELVTLTTVNATPRSSSEVSHEITT